MIKLPADAPRFPRVAAYSVLAALVTTALFAADGAYRRYRDASVSVAVPKPAEPTLQASAPAPAETHASNPPSQAAIQLPQRETAVVEHQVDEQRNSGSLSNPSVAIVPNPAVDPAPDPAIASVPGPAVPGAGPVEAEVSQRQQPQLSKQQPKRQQVRRLPAKQAAHDRAKARRPVQTVKPNVYWERDSQLGFAPQLRKRTCNPATGHMPMQCYYPREGRERFPARPLN